MVGLRFPLSPLWFVLGYGSGFRVKAAKVSVLPFSLLSLIRGFRFSGLGSRFGV